MREALFILVAGGDERGRDDAVAEIRGALRLSTRTDDVDVRVFSTSDDFRQLMFTHLESHHG